MAYSKVTSYEAEVNFLESEIGLVTKTYTGSQAKAVVDETSGRKLIKAGTAYPSNDSSAIGIVFVTADMTDDAKKPISVMVAGRVFEDRVDIAEGAKTALAAKGITFVPTYIGTPDDGE